MSFSERVFVSNIFRNEIRLTFVKERSAFPEKNCYKHLRITVTWELWRILKFPGIDSLESLASLDQKAVSNDIDHLARRAWSMESFRENFFTSSESVTSTFTDKPSQAYGFCFLTQLCDEF